MSKKTKKDNYSYHDNDIQNVLDVFIEEEIKKSYIDYAMSVIVSRALPDVRDGLKPVQRRILYAMYKEGLFPNGKFSKSMGVVGEVLKKYHPHGDAAVYDALARMVQDWVMRYPLIDGQGNFGTIDGDSPAAPRYTECRLAKISLNFLDNIEKNVVNFVPNYTGEYVEPVVLPARIPNLLLNGADGIAVGMATKIPPHNLNEILDAVIYMIQNDNDPSNNVDFNYSKYCAFNYEDALNYNIDKKQIPYPNFTSSVSIDDLMKFIKGPDFPTGANIYNFNDIKSAYANGRGRILMRAEIETEEISNGKNQIIIKELPYQVNKAKLAERIYDLYKDGKIDGISDIRDESNTKEGIRLVIDLKKGFSPNVLVNKLYKFTELQSVFNVNMVAIVNGEPKLLSLKEILENFIKFQYELLIRTTIFDINEKIKRIHILEGLKIAIDNIDEVISLIRSSKTADEAKLRLIDRFKFSEYQAQAILEMQLRKLAALESLQIEQEYNNLLKEVNELKELIDSYSKASNKIIDYLTEIKNKYGDNRKTRVYKSLDSDLSLEDIVQEERVIISLSRVGYIKRMKESEFKLQNRGGKGSVGALTKDNDYVYQLVYCTTLSELILFSNKGKAYSINAYLIPEMNRKSKGIHISNLINLEKNERITVILVKNKGEIIDQDQSQEDEVSKEFRNKDNRYLVMCTLKGIVKKIDLNELNQIRKSGVICINLDQNDELRFVRPTNGNSEIMIMTNKAKTVRFHEDNISLTGRLSRGVRGIKLVNDDFVVMLDVIRKLEDRVLVISENGFAKITLINEFPIKRRGIKGVIGYKITSKTGNVAIARIIDHPNRELILMSSRGQVIRTKLTDITDSGRQTKGVIVFRLSGNDKIATCALI